MALYDFILKYFITCWIEVDLSSIVLFDCGTFTVKAIDVFNTFYIISLSCITCYIFVYSIYKLFKFIVGIKK